MLDSEDGLGFGEGGVLVLGVFDDLAVGVLDLAQEFGLGDGLLLYHGWDWCELVVR